MQRLFAKTAMVLAPEALQQITALLGRSQQPSPHAEPAITPTPITPPQHPVDIIVPVYRGLADTRLCIDSVLASTNQSAWRLVVINEASPEPEVTAWLRERAAQDSRITLLENRDNLGFVGTVNRGMALSDSNDVLLLNSDTEVAGDWLDRLRQAALQGIAEQTPPAEILEPRGQNPAQQPKEQRRQRQRAREQHAGAERVDRVIIRADVGQMCRAAAEKLPPQIVLDRVGAEAVQDPVNARRVKHPHAVNSQKDQHPQQCAGQRPAVFFQCFHLTFSGQRSWTAWWTS